MADPKQEETFKVIDRRLFTEEGELRKDVVEEQERREEQKAAKANAASATTTSTTTANATAGLAGTGGQSGDANAPSRGIQMLVDFLTRNAAALLGGMADPRTGQPLMDLEGAREMIDMLDALREKTRGNLAKADEEMLIEVIGSLKLSYMEISKAAAEAMSKKAGGKR